MYIRFYATLRDLIGAPGVTLDVPAPVPARELLRRLAAMHPALGLKLWDEHEQLTGQVRVFINGRGVEWLAGLDTQVRAGDDVRLFPPVGGG